MDFHQECCDNDHHTKSGKSHVWHLCPCKIERLGSKKRVADITIIFSSQMGLCWTCGMTNRWFLEFMESNGMLYWEK